MALRKNRFADPKAYLVPVVTALNQVTVPLEATTAAATEAEVFLTGSKSEIDPSSAIGGCK